MRCHTPYCAQSDMKDFEHYYVSQAGHGMPVFAGGVSQRGHGLGSIFASIGRSVLPLLKSGVSRIGREVVQSGARFAGDVLAGHSPRSAAIKRTREAGRSLLTSAQRSFAQPPGERVKKRRKVEKRKKQRKRDIFM